MDDSSTTIHSDSRIELELFQQAQLGNREAIAALAQRYRGRLKLLISSRLDARVAQRVDDSDIVQEILLRLVQDESRNNKDQRDDPTSNSMESDEKDHSPYLWFRKLAIWTLGDIQRKHLGVQQRDPRREISLHEGTMYSASSVDIARILIGSNTRPLDAMVQLERGKALEKALDELDAMDREILMLRHGEQLSRVEAAKILNISVSAAAKRYTRALTRVRQVLKEWEP